MSSPVGLASLRIVAGEIETRSATTRLVIPSTGVPEFPPFRRVGETVAGRARQLAAHAHEAEEVLTYVTDGFASYQLESEPAQLVERGSARLLTASARASHRISPARGGAIRWFNLVLGPISGTTGPPRLQSSEPPHEPQLDQKAAVRLLVGPGAPMSSAAGLECRVIEFVEPSTTFLRVGHDRRAVVYALTGRGTVESRPIDAGEAALVDGVAALAVQGSPGLRVVAATLPAPRGGSPTSAGRPSGTADSARVPPPA